MKKSTQKGLLSIAGGMIVGPVIYGLSMDTYSVMGFIISLFVSGLLGYMIVSSVIMSDKESKEFEQKFEKFFEEDDKEKTST